MVAAHRLADEHDLAGRPGLKDLLVRAPRLGEWQYLANNGPQSAVCETCKEPGVDVRLFDRCISQSVNARIEARRAISSRGLMVTSPRLPITMTRPLLARSFVSCERFTLASISKTTPT